MKNSKLYYISSAVIFLAYIVLSIINSGTWYALSTLYLALLLFSVAVYLSRKTLLHNIKQRGTKTAMGAILSFILLFGIVLSVNYIIKQHNVHFDLTRNKINTLSQQTQDIVKHLKDKLEFIAFVKTGPDLDYMNSVFKKYKYLNKDKVSYSNIDPNVDPITAQKFGIRSYGTVVVQYKGKNIKIDKIDEETITNTIIKLTRLKTKHIYFLTGHAEPSIEQEDSSGLKTLKTYLEDEGYKVAELNILLKGVPKDASLIIAFEPKKVFLEKEIKSLTDFYTKEGHALLLLKGPEILKKMHTVIKSINKLLEPSGLKLNNDFVVETQTTLSSISMGLNNTMPVAANYSTTHKITKNFRDITFYPIAQSLSTSSNENFTDEELVASSVSAVGLLDPKAGKIDLRKVKHNNGPLTLVAIAENKDKGKVVVFGSSLFASNQYIDYASNKDIILNTISYLLNDSDLISIRPKKDDVAQFKMKYPWLPVIYIYLLPVIILVFGIGFWIKKKRS